MCKPIKIINNIEINKDKYSDNGLSIIVRNPISQQGVGMHLKNVSTKDLRDLADFIDNHKKENNIP